MESLSQLLPQEERLAVSNEQKSLKIGLPKEQTFQEHRICLTPDEVAVLVVNGHQIPIEAGAGEEAHFSDTDYSEAGAEIVYDTQEVFVCPIVLKVQPPTTDELAYFNAQSVLLSALQLNTQDKTYFETLAQKQITALAFEYIKDEAENHPIQQSVDELTGIAAVLTASELLAAENRLLLGNITGIPPTEVVLLGANELTEAAAKTVLGLGANVKIFAPSLTDLRKLRTHLPSSVYTATLQPQPIVVTEKMVQQMKRGAVIVDASIGIGGCIETSQLTTLEQLTFTKYEVVHCGVPNLPSRYAHTASTLLSNILLSYLLKIGEEGGVENLLQIDKGFRNGLYSYHGIITHHNISEWFGLPYKPLHLLFL